jgi:hypothetical protein
LVIMQIFLPPINTPTVQDTGTVINKVSQSIV